jgi:hypothetical protein
MNDFEIVSNESGLSLMIVRNYEPLPTDNYFPILGGDNRNQSWQEYFDEMKQSIEDNRLIGCTGQYADDLYFKYSDGVVFSFSWRGWGDLMQSIVDKREGYMTYYM